jgi:hypothetical protein
MTSTSASTPRVERGELIDHRFESPQLPNSPMSSSFDFKEYLRSICPEDEFEVSVLTGGLVNFTVRAHRTSAVGNTGPLTLRDHTSFILKHAPSYIATIGESAPFSQYRQVCSLSNFLTIDHRGSCLGSLREYRAFQSFVRETSVCSCTSAAPP